MSLVRWYPFNELNSLQNEINKVFGPLDYGKKNVEQLVPAIDVSETKEEYKIKADLPGISKENVDISMLGNTLTIKGERKESHEEKEHNFYKKEITYGSFQRQVILPEDIDSDKIKAAYDNGVLELRIPKAERTKSRKISIE